jgi:hypothetical protein
MAKTTTTTGILLLAFGKPQYAQMAYNLAFSIRHFDRDVAIHLVTDANCLSGIIPGKRWVFNSFEFVKPEDVKDANGKFSPGKVKTRIDEYSPFDNTFYLDVDAICLKPLQPMIDAFLKLPGYFYLQSASWGTPTEKCPMHNLTRDGMAFPAMQWALPEKIWEVHKLPEDAEVPATNSSILFFRKGAECTKFFAQVRDNIDNGLKPGEYSLLWGGSYPDELAFNIACAQLKVDPSAGINPIWFQFGKPMTKPQAMIDNYYILGLYGGAGTTHSSAWEYYDRLLHSMHRTHGFAHEYKSQYLIPVKHQGTTKVLKRQP